jgi:tetratricopeptide (TPR) repeat protein
MDFASLVGAVMLAIGLIGADTIVHSGSIVVEVTAAPQMEGESIDQPTLESVFDDELYEITRTPSVLEPPEIRTARDQGLGMALAKAVGASEVAYQLQSMVGRAPDRLRLALFLEKGQLRGEVSATTRNVGTFHQVLDPLKDESTLAFVRRCAIWSASRVAPYMTALYLMQQHAADKNFTDVLALMDKAEAELPNTPVSFDRAAFDNLRGIIFLFQSKPDEAQKAFDQAMDEYPANPVSEINAAFADLELDLNQKAADRMKEFIANRPPQNKVMLATAYMTWAAAEMALHNWQAADPLLAKANEINPDSSSAFELRAELNEEELHNPEAAARYHRQAMLNAATFENYGEVAALYFKLSWRDGEPITQSNFSNPKIVTFH